MNEQQRAAVEATGEVFVSAGAGTGKTAVLVERCVRGVCERGLDVDSVLVITYTRRAAGELRLRIRAALAERGRHEPEQEIGDRVAAPRRNVDESERGRRYRGGQPHPACYLCQALDRISAINRFFNSSCSHGEDQLQPDGQSAQRTHARLVSGDAEMRHDPRVDRR